MKVSGLEQGKQRVDLAFGNYSLNITPFRIFAFGPFVVQAIWTALWVLVALFGFECSPTSDDCHLAGLIPLVFWFRGELLLLPLSIISVAIAFIFMRDRRPTRPEHP